ncbi:MAG: hypothetical protein R6U67_17190 [Sodalinema sp.]|uniref:hypothetical protein n=1 Tax=Sodalinema sp. TaxID=3080550 RepID=UPI00396F2C2F
MRSLRTPLILFGLTLLLTGVAGIGHQGDRPATATQPTQRVTQDSHLALFDDLPSPDDLPIPDIDISDILEGDPPLTTSLDDVVREVPLLDDRDFGEPQSLTQFPQTDDGGYLATPGLYEITLESYCLRAGTHGPGGGDGYGYAPLEGPQADSVRKILREAANHPDIEQRSIQKLLWGIIAQTSIRDMSQELQDVAQTLLTDEDIRELNGNALDLIPEAARREIFANLPDPVRQVLEAEAELRSALSQADAAYEDLEDIAILTGDAPRGEGSRTIPQQRWSLHPDGYFVRYFPSGYRRTRMEVLVPRPVTVVRDDLNRITALDYDNGYRIETDYDDEIGAIPVPGEPDLQIYQFSSVRLIRPGKTVEVRDRGWTFVGMPTTGEADFSQEAMREVASLKTTLAQRGGNVDWQEAQERYEQAQETAETVQDTQDRLEGNVNREDAEGVVDYDHYEEGLDTVAEQDREAQGEWLGEHFENVQDGFAYAICKLRNLGTAGSCGDPEPDQPDRDPDPDPNGDPNPDPPGTPVNPGGDGAVPGNTSRQRLGLSGRSAL